MDSGSQSFTAREMIPKKHQMLVKSKRLVVLGACNALLLLTGCVATPPECVVTTTGAMSNSNAKPVSRSNSLELAFDGSASMLGYVAEGKPAESWQALVNVINQSAAAINVNVVTYRVGGGKVKNVASVQKATQPCFYQGCGQYGPVASSLHTLWEKEGLIPSSGGAAPKIPLRMLVTDLEANDGDISAVIKSVRPHVEQGAVIGVVALKVPFNGSVYNSKAKIIYKGETNRPIYLVATGSPMQTSQLLNTLQKSIEMSRLGNNELHITDLKKHVTKPTQTAIDGRGNAQFGVPIRVGKETYGSRRGYVMAKMAADSKELMVGATNLPAGNKIITSLNIGNIEPIIPISTEIRGESIKGATFVNDKLVFQLSIPNPQLGNAVRLNVARGELPEQWWVNWTRLDPKKPDSEEKTEGLRPLMTNFARMMIDENNNSTPAASLCVMYSK